MTSSNPTEVGSFQMCEYRLKILRKDWVINVECRIIEVNSNGRVTFVVDLEVGSEAWIKAIEAIKEGKIYKL